MRKVGRRRRKFPFPNDQSVIESKGAVVAPSNTRAMPPTMAGIAAWYRRSSLRSDLRDTPLIAVSPAAWTLPACTASLLLHVFAPLS